MSRETQLIIHSENADLVTFASLDRFLARQNECGFAEVGLARQLLHFDIAQASGVRKDGELVAF